MSDDGQHVAVIGAGTMGHGIAQVAAMAGCDVRLVDTDTQRVEEGLERIRGNLDKGVELGKVAPELRESALARIDGGTDIGAAAGDADLAIEAVPEKFDLKAQILGQIDEYAPEGVVIATNTSGLSITELQATTARPARVVGMHFFNPVHIMALVEVVRGDATEETVVDAAVAFAEEAGKQPIVVNDSPGFASSRLGVALGLEAMRMVEEGVAAPEDVDKAMTLGYNHPMGPLRLTDLIGLDVRLDIASYLHKELGAEHFRPPAILRRLVDEGKLGKKAGEGFYTWEE